MYCCYSVQDVTNGLVVDFELLKRGRDSKSSVLLEREGCKRVLSRIAKCTPIFAFSSDRAPSIRSLLAQDFPQVNHQFDPWHLTKSLRKKLFAVAQKRGMEALLPWIRHILNHVWYCAMSCEGNEENLIIQWSTLLYHITGTHSWIGEDGHTKHCRHGVLSDEREIDWLEAGSLVHQELGNILLKPTLLKDLRRLSLDMHTSFVESLHAVVNKYAPKRLFFREDSMSIRLKLAIMDHNYSIGRKVVGISEVFKKSTNRMTKVQVKEAKCFLWRNLIFDECMREFSE